MSKKSVQATKQVAENAIKQEISLQAHIEPAHGFEEITSDSLTIPFLNIVQDLTPLYKQENRPEGIKTGMIYDSVSQELFTRITVIPVSFNRRYIEWKPRTAGGGFVAIHEQCPPDARRIDNRVERANGNTIMDTRQHYVLYRDNNNLWNMALISLRSTGIQTSQQWLTQMGRCREPILNTDGQPLIDKETGEPAYRQQHMYERKYELFTQLKHKNNNSWFAWGIKLLPEKVAGNAFREAEAFYKMLQAHRINLQETYAQDSAANTEHDDVAY